MNNIYFHRNIPLESLVGCSTFMNGFGSSVESESIATILHSMCVP